MKNTGDPIDIIVAATPAGREISGRLLPLREHRVVFGDDFPEFRPGRSNAGSRRPAALELTPVR